MKKEKAKKLTTKFQTLKSNHAITLIALIITIVVMLILVAVTLTIALGENGVVNNAKEAKVKTETEIEREKLLDAVFATVGSSGEVKLEDIVLPQGFSEVSRDGNKITYQGPSGTQFEVEDITGDITEGEEDDIDGGTPPSSENEWVDTYTSINYGDEFVVQLNADKTFNGIAEGSYKFVTESELSTSIGAQLLMGKAGSDNKYMSVDDGEREVVCTTNGMSGMAIDGLSGKTFRYEGALTNTGEDRSATYFELTFGEDGTFIETNDGQWPQDTGTVIYLPDRDLLNIGDYNYEIERENGEIVQLKQVRYDSRVFNIKS